MAAKKYKHKVLAPHGCGDKNFWAEVDEVVKLTTREAKPFVAQGLVEKI